MRLRRRRRGRNDESVVVETPKPEPRVRTIIDPDAERPVQELVAGEAGEETAELDDLTRRRLRREFLSMEKRRKLEAAGEKSGENGQPEARLIIKARGGEIVPEPRRAVDTVNGDSTFAERSPGDPDVPRLERRASPPRRTHEVKLEAVARGKPEAEGEDRWTDEQKGVSLRWSVIVAGGMGLLVVMALVGVQVLSVMRREDGVRVQPVVDFEVERIELGEAKELLEANPGALYEEACQILQGYNGAGEASEALVWVRRADRERETFLRAWRRWESPPYFERPELIQYGVMSFQIPPALVVWGLRTDFTPFRAYFVLEGGRLRLDWKATEAFSDISLSELPNAGEVETLTLRSVVQAKPFHTAALPEDKYRSFLLSGPDGEDYVWGYAERKSEVDRKLDDILRRGTGMRETRSRGRATLVVTSPERRDLDSQFLIAEVLHNEWVGP